MFKFVLILITAFGTNTPYFYDYDACDAELRSITDKLGDDVIYAKCVPLDKPEAPLPGRKKS